LNTAMLSQKVIQMLSRMSLFLVVSMVVLPAFANSMAPILPMISFFGWLGLPLIVLVEGFFWRRKGLKEPFRFSLYANFWSSLVGIIPAALTFWIMVGPFFDGDVASLLRSGRRDSAIYILILSGIASSLGFVFHWWFTTQIEYRYFLRQKWESTNSQFSKKDFYLVNAITYALLAMLIIGQQIQKAWQLLN